MQFKLPILILMQFRQLLVGKLPKNIQTNKSDVERDTTADCSFMSKRDDDDDDATLFVAWNYCLL
jgi:hypothetical protein